MIDETEYQRGFKAASQEILDLIERNPFDYKLQTEYIRHMIAFRRDWSGVSSKEEKINNNVIVNEKH